VSHRAALVTIATAAVLDTGLGVAFGAADHIGAWRGLFFAVTTATTVGYGDLTAHGWLPHLLAVAMMLLVVPLFGAAFSLFTSGLTVTHVRGAEKRIKAHLEERLKAHHKALASHPGAPGG